MRCQVELARSQEEELLQVLILAAAIVARFKVVLKDENGYAGCIERQCIRQILPGLLLLTVLLELSSARKVLCMLMTTLRPGQCTCWVLSN